MTSDLKPKVICKNLQDIIKESMFSTKRSSIQANQKRQTSQRYLKSQPRQRRSTERCNTSASRCNKLYESGKRLNTSISKHSLQSKEKIKIIQNKISSNTGATKPPQQKKSKHSVLPTSSIQFYPSSIKNPQKLPISQQPPPSHFKSLCFNQIDAILTQLEDFIRETRQKICLEMDFVNDQMMANILAEQLSELSGVFKSQLEGVIGRSLYVEGECDVLRPKNRVNERNRNENKHTTTNKAYSSSENPTQPTPFQQQQQLIKIQQFMRRQHTITSTINSQPHQDPYIPTQTDAQLLSMLVYKNKLSSTKRKLQSTDSYGQELMSPWVKQGRSVNRGEEAEYSFRNNRNGSRESKEKEGSNSGTVREVDMRRKKNGQNTREKSVYSSNKENKENREKSIYQLVLQENRKAKHDWKR